MICNIWCRTEHWSFDSLLDSIQSNFQSKALFATEQPRTCRLANPGHRQDWHHRVVPKGGDQEIRGEIVIATALHYSPKLIFFMKATAAFLS